jgi:hypothetical protein
MRLLHRRADPAEAADVEGDVARGRGSFSRGSSGMLLLGMPMTVPSRGAGCRADWS